jgi:NADP-dependent 3-hydroxy acid dehydrogenase YdfG
MVEIGQWRNFRKYIFVSLSVLAFIFLGKILSTQLGGLSQFRKDRAQQRSFEKYQSQLAGATNIQRKDSKNILVAGGSGYIGVHTIVVLLDAGYDVTVVDNLANSSPEGLKRVLEFTKVDPYRIRFFQVDLRDEQGLEEVFRNSPKFTAAIHFAGLKSVGESIQKPLLYYDNNMDGTLILLRLMEKHGCRAIIFSSSATVYGHGKVPIKESSQVGIGITNAYGRTKYFIEEVLKVCLVCSSSSSCLPQRIFSLLFFFRISKVQRIWKLPRNRLVW